MYGDRQHIHQYTVDTGEYKIVADYANMSIPEVYELTLIEYMELFRDAVIYNNMKSEEGNKRLDDAWIMEQTKPDRNALKEVLRKG